MFIREIGAVAPGEGEVDLADQTESGAGEFEIDGLAVLVGFEGGVELPAGEDGGVGDADFLDFFEVEETTAIGQGMQGHDADGGFVGVEQGQGDHGDSSEWYLPVGQPDDIVEQATAFS